MGTSESLAIANEVIHEHAVARTARRANARTTVERFMGTAPATADLSRELDERKILQSPREHAPQRPGQREEPGATDERLDGDGVRGRAPQAPPTDDHQGDDDEQGPRSNDA